MGYLPCYFEIVIARRVLFIEAIGICFAAIMVLTYGVNGNA